MKTIELEPIKESTDDYDRLEACIAKLFKEQIYFPLLKELGIAKKTLENSIDDLLSAIKSGRIYFYRGNFKGRFNSVTSKELKRIGAKWDRKQGSWKIPLGSLPPEVNHAIAASEYTFKRKLESIDRKLQQMLPAEIADKLKAESIFDSSLWKIDKEFHKTVNGITVAPKLTPERRAKIAKEYENNMKLYIKDFTEKEIVELRKQIQQSGFKGNRYESVVKTIEKSYGVSHNKAKFLARQETSLLMTKFKETRYNEAGVNQYKWKCVAGSANHPVRPMHKVLDGKVFNWNNPPITDEKGSRNNPGQDYNCRCFAIPIVRF